MRRDLPVPSFRPMLGLHPAGRACEGWRVVTGLGRPCDGPEHDAALSLGSEIARAYNALQEPDPTCPVCNGDGWYVGHDDECYDKGDCVCSGVQIECHECQGKGRDDA